MESIMDGSIDMYKKMYAILFNAISDALEEMSHLNYGLATTILRLAQGDAESIYVCWPDDEAEQALESDLTAEERKQRRMLRGLCQKCEQLREHLRELDRQKIEWEKEQLLQDNSDAVSC